MSDSRKQFWIDPFQTKLFYRVALYWVIYTLTLFNLTFGWRLIKEGTQDVWQVFAATVADNLPLFVSLILVAPWIGLDAVRFANRIVGPLFRFRKAMQSVTAHEPVRPIRLRKDDFLMEMQDDFNAMLDALEQRGAVHREQASGAPAEVGG